MPRDIMRSSESHKGQVSAFTVYVVTVVLITQFTTCHEPHCR